MEKSSARRGKLRTEKRCTKRSYTGSNNIRYRTEKLCDTHYLFFVLLPFLHKYWNSAEHFFRRHFEQVVVYIPSFSITGTEKPSKVMSEKVVHILLVNTAAFTGAFDERMIL